LGGERKRQPFSSAKRAAASPAITIASVTSIRLRERAAA
jgi:hypothetical protein